MRNIQLHKSRARALRKDCTEPERTLWYHLRGRRFVRYKFRRQYIIHPYIVDFICLHKKLIVELDGGQHAKQIVYDKERTKFLNHKGYEVLRFWNDQIFTDETHVLETILHSLAKHE